MLKFTGTRLARSERQGRVRALVDEHVEFVARVLRRAGVPRSELDDEIQRTFIVVTGRLEDIQPGSERSFLFQVAHNIASHTRRRLGRRREVLDDRPPERIETLATPEFLTDRKQVRQLLNGMIESLHQSLRAVFTLFAFDELNLSEIAAALGLPRGTVASRLRRARAQLREHVAAIDLGRDLGVAIAPGITEPTLLRRERMSVVQHALLVAGAAARAPAATRARTLVALGLFR